MRPWRRSAYFIPLAVVAASLMVLQIKAGHRKQVRARIPETRPLYSRDLDGPAEGGSMPVKAEEEMKMVIRPSKVCLRLDTFPSGAYVLLDRRGRGRSPLALKGLKPGRHLVEICKPGYIVQRMPVDLVTDARLSIKLKGEPRPRLVHLLPAPERRSSEPAMRQAAARPPQRQAKREEPPVRPAPAPCAKKKEPSRVAGLIRDPLGAERHDKGLSVF